MTEKKTILAYITETLPERNTSFVFPSEVPARFWLQKAAEHSLKPVAADRFIAWDSFKQQTLSVRHERKQAVNDAARTLFASNLIKENQRGISQGTPLLREIVNPRLPGSSSSFISSIARMLPSLETVFRHGDPSLFRRDAYFEDLRAIYGYYSAFLDDHDLYEPSWNRAPFESAGTRWILFFPELAEDWGEYAGELSQREAQGSGEVAVISLDRIAPPDEHILPPEKKVLIEKILNGNGRGIRRFSSSADEYIRLALTIRRLLSEGGLSPADIAVSMPGLGDNAERLRLELKLRDIPADIRAGANPAEHPGGRIFAHLASCRENKWSYESLKNLLLDKAYPWKEADTIGLFLEFGLEYRCVSGFTEDGKTVDVWKRSFSRTWEQDGPVHFPVKRLRSWYRRFKGDVLKVVRARSFSALKQGWIIFEKNHLEDRASFPAETDTLLSRAMDTLDELIDIEEKLPDLKGFDPFSVFRSYLGEKKYVFQAGTEGIPVYEYRVAAGIAPPVHFILNMNQEDASVRESSVPFLREDRKYSVNLPDQDLSALFIKAYTLSAAFPVFSVPERTFRGPALPHHLLRETAGADEFRADAASAGEDPIKAEELLLRGQYFESCPPVSRIQREGWEACRISRAAPLPEDIRSSPVSDPGLASRLAASLSHKGDRLSPTDLNEYIRCPFAWLLKRGLGIREQQTRIETIDKRDLGILYHRILERLFSRIQREHRRFRADQLECYKGFLQEEIRSALEEERSREGAFQESVYEMLAGRIRASLEAYLEQDLPVLGDAEISGAEFPLRLDYPSIGIALSGKADLVLLDNDGNYILTDFKTSALPAAASLIPAGAGHTSGDNREGIPENLQMASYMRMLEAGAGHPVRTARFYSLEERKYRKVVDQEASGGNSRRSPLPLEREQYEAAVTAVDTVLASAAASMDGGDYRIPPHPRRSGCHKCPVNPVCRITFSGGEA